MKNTKNQCLKKKKKKNKKCKIYKITKMQYLKSQIIEEKTQWPKRKQSSKPIKF